MIKEAITKIVNKQDLTYDEAYTVMSEIMSGETSPTQNAAFLAALTTTRRLPGPSFSPVHTGLRDSGTAVPGTSFLVQ